MRRSQPALLLIGLALILGAAAYAGAAAYRRLAPPRRTVRAESAVWTDAVTLTGAVIRTEIRIPRRLSALRYIAPDGVRLAAEEALAIEYDTGEEYFASALLLRLRRELSAEEDILSRSPSEPGDQELRTSLESVRTAAARSDGPALFAAAHDAELSLFPRNVTPERTALLRGEIRALERRGAGERILTAPAAGLFFSETDGWEDLSAEGESLSAEELDAVLASPAKPSGCAGRIVTGSKWLLAAFVDPDQAGLLPPGEAVVLELPEGGLDARVARLYSGADGRLMVILECSRGLEAAAGRRVLTAAAVLRRVQGLCLPAGAVGRDGDGDYVIRSAGPFLRRETVTVLDRRDGMVLLSSPGLRPGSEVITDIEEYG